MHLIVYGPEGSGKGTQAKLLAEKLNLKVITSGDLVRDTALNDKGELGEACRLALSEGKYVDDKKMFALWENKLQDVESKKGFILDGFPRNTVQAEFLLQNVEKNEYRIDKVIYINISDNEAVKRLALRHRELFTGSHINHDDPKRVKQRLAIYRAKEKDLLEFFQKRNLLIEIDGNKNIRNIADEIYQKLNIE